MIIRTPLGNVNCEKIARGTYSPVSHATVRITFNDTRDSDSEFIKSLSRDFHSIRKRSDVTAEWVKATVDSMLERDDLDGLEIRSVDVDLVSSAWSTPYHDLYPEKGD